MAGGPFPPSATQPEARPGLSCVPHRRRAPRGPASTSRPHRAWPPHTCAGRHPPAWPCAPPSLRGPGTPPSCRLSAPCVTRGSRPCPTVLIHSSVEEKLVSGGAKLCPVSGTHAHGPVSRDPVVTGGTMTCAEQSPGRGPCSAQAGRARQAGPREPGPRGRRSGPGRAPCTPRAGGRRPSRRHSTEQLSPCRRRGGAH